MILPPCAFARYKELLDLASDDKDNEQATKQPRAVFMFV